MFERALQKAEQKRKLIQRAERRYEREAFASWSSVVMQKAEKAGVRTPSSVDLTLLKRLAEIEGPFSASQVVRRGWCGIRSVDDATSALERFVDNGWLHNALPNREGLPRYSFTREHALGTLPHDERPYDSLAVWEAVRPSQMLMEAEFLHVSDDTDQVEEDAIAECEFCEVPDQTVEGDIWAVARKLAYEEGTPLHRIAEGMDGLSPIQQAYAMAIAQDRVMRSDPIKTHVRGIADYLGVDYNALRAAIAAAVSAIRSLNDESGKEKPWTIPKFQRLP